MRVGELAHVDQTFARVLGIIGGALIAGLLFTGVWQFLFHEPSEFASYVPGSLEFSPRQSVGMASVHGTLADLSAVVALLGAAWFSARVIFRVSWFGVAAMVALIGALLTGARIRFNAVQRNGVIDPDASGYSQFFGGDAQLVATDRLEMSATTMAVWTSLHVLILPVLLAAAWFVWSRSRKRVAALPPAGDSWLDQLPAD